jgi:hypothetical protein
VFRVQQQDASRAGAQQQVLTLAPGLSTTEARSAAVAGVLGELRSKQGLLSGWRDELYPVAPAFDAPPLLLIERAAAPFFGIRAYGVHVNGYVVQPDGTKQLWVARRSTSKQTWPGKLDHIVAGGQVGGCTCVQDMLCAVPLAGRVALGSCPSAWFAPPHRPPILRARLPSSAVRPVVC